MSSWERRYFTYRDDICSELLLHLSCSRSPWLPAAPSPTPGRLPPALHPLAGTGDHRAHLLHLCLEAAMSSGAGGSQSTPWSISGPISSPSGACPQCSLAGLDLPLPSPCIPLTASNFEGSHHPASHLRAAVTLGVTHSHPAGLTFAHFSGPLSKPDPLGHP